MIAFKAASRLVLAATLVALPIQVFAKKPEKCSAEIKYVGQAAISVAIPTMVAASPRQAPTDQDAFAALFTDMLTKSKATSLTVALAGQTGSIWTKTQGLQGSEKLHYWASVGKSFTAIVIMQLVEDGRLSLDDTLSSWIDGVPNGDLITVRMLLNHTSGLYSANEDQDAAKNQPAALSLKDNIRILKKHGPLFCPGQYWRYSNTGYLFLGEIAEQVYGQPLSEVIQNKIIDKIGLKNSYMVTIGDNLSDVAKPRPSGDQKSDIRTPGAAGPMAATSSDMVLFWRAFLNGDLVSPDTRDVMFSTLYPMFDKNMFYGLGVMAMRAPGPDGEPAIWIGHAGGMPGIKAFVMIDPASLQYAAVALTGDGPASAVAYNMLREWQSVSVPQPES